MPDPFFSDVVALHHFDTNFSDYSQYAIPSWNINATISNVQSKFGGSSCRFNGTNAYVVLPQRKEFEIGTGDFTVECWVYMLTNHAGVSFISDQYTGAGNPIIFSLGLHDFSTAGGSNLAFGHYTGSGWNGILASVGLSLNTWTHVAGVRANGVATLYKDGVPVGYNTSLTNSLVSHEFIWIGRRWDTFGTNSFWNGYIDEVRISKRARYGTIPLQTAAFPGDVAGDPDFGSVTVLLRGDSNPIVESSNNTFLSITGGATASTTQSKFGGSSLYFPNTTVSTNACVSGTTTGVNFGSGNFTIECWFYPLHVVNYMTLFSTRPDNAGYADAVHIYIAGDGSIGVYSNSSDAVARTGLITANQWYHVALCRNGNELKLYLNGNLVAVNTSYTKTPTRTFYGIGQHPVGATEGFYGYIDEVRVTKGIARYTQTFTPSSVPFEDNGLPTPSSGALVSEPSGFSRYFTSQVQLLSSDSGNDIKYTRAVPLRSFGVYYENSTPGNVVRNQILNVSNGFEYKFNSGFRNDDQPIWKNPAFTREQDQINILPTYRKPFKLVEPR